MYDSLNARLLAAHEKGEGPDLAAIYEEAAVSAEAAGDADRASFFLTHAWIFALEAGLPSALRLKTELVRRGCDVMTPVEYANRQRQE